ncbi:hypothetical protein RD792_017441 [Penstemon davidsonii]|uniref:DNA-directed RNA polymerase subunit n=1 Tax=Penstemon davidsonii TaxID=160366 RepID=A0ABR0CM06_9LAMI|nr:hypothetical protein RD792_017441 [Penstemon davidsonii]
MIREIIFDYEVHFPTKNLEKNGEILTSFIVTKLLNQLSRYRACKCGYLLAVTKLVSIGHGHNKSSPHCTCFPVEFRCRTFIPVNGEIFTGVVKHVLERGVFLKSGPMNIVYLSSLKMPNFNYVSDKIEKLVFMRDDLSKIEVGVVVRFVVFAVKWVEDRQREFRVLASIDGDGLGPVSSNGLDELDL